MARAYDLTSIAGILTAGEVRPDTATQERQAAVAAILRAPGDPEEAEILLIRRAERVGDPWSGHMAFPGGQREPGDASMLDTALRETREEIGLDLAMDGKMLARLPEIPATARGRRVGMVVSPFVFALREGSTPVFTFSEEVAEAIWIPLGPLARGERVAEYTYQHEGKAYPMPGFQVGDRVVWGLTYWMLESLFGALHRA